MAEKDSFELNRIGSLLKKKGKIIISLEKKYQRGLKQIEHFNHLHIFWWGSGEDSIQLTTVKMVNISDGEIEIAPTAIPEKSAIIDIKAYIPMEDRVQNYKIPQTAPSREEWFYSETSNKAVVSDGREVPFSVKPLGEINHQGGRIFIKIDQQHIEYIKMVEGYSHLQLIWYFNRLDNPTLRKMLVCNPPYEAPKTGVFASRAPVRPNPLALSVCAIKNINLKKGIIEIDDCDAFTGTPVIALKPYLPALVRVRNVKVPAWLSHWPGWYREKSDKENHVKIKESDVQKLSYFSAPAKPAEFLQEKQSKKYKNRKDAINLYGARQNNLKNIDVSIPLEKMTVVTGVSGSGKSSLAFDTIYAEGQRRYMQSLSTSSRMAAGLIEKPDFDNIQNLLPAVAIEQKNITKNPRSTVGTISDVYSYMRLLYSRLGIRHCTKCGTEVSPQTAESLYRKIKNLNPGTQISFFPGRNEPSNEDVYIYTVGQKKDPVSEYSLGEIISRCYSSGSGFLTMVINDQTKIRVTEKAACINCDSVFFKMSPSLFSYNSPAGMCQTCNGLGTKMEVDPGKVISNPELSVLDGASPWYGDLRSHRKKPNANWFRNEILALAEAMKVDLELPWKELPLEFREKALYGSGDEEFQYSYNSGKTGRSGTITRPVGGAVNHIQRLFKTSKAGNSQEVYKHFLTYSPCPVCENERLSAEGRFVILGGKRFPEAAAMTIEAADKWVKHLPAVLSESSKTAVKNLLEELSVRLQSMMQVGLYYLSLDRPITTLSGGEAQRIKLASQLGCGLSGLLYVLDEPSIGLHPVDHRKMIETMKKLRDGGNTVLVVEHDEETMLAADHIIDIGEGAGIHGGEVIAEGSPQQIIKNPKSITGKFLKSSKKIDLPEAQKPTEFMTLSGASLHNLKDIEVKFPIGRVSCVTGVSGSGKSSLIRGTLVPALLKKLNKMDVESGDYSAITGTSNLGRIINVDQSSIGRSPRSIPVTYIGLFDEIRNIFAKTAQAKLKKYKSSRFSFNDKAGRCPNCEGSGKIKIDMNFLPNTWITCSDCDGRRYNRETLDITLKEKNIADVLDMDVEEAIDFFKGEEKILKYLFTMRDVGLEYLKLGQSSVTLSGGEAQRIKLARELTRQESGNNLYVLDEPTTGLHFSDTAKLLVILHRLAERGNTVIIIEHNLTVIKTSHWIVDLGPSGGEAGGHLIGQGSPGEISKIKKSFTGRFLLDLSK